MISGEAYASPTWASAPNHTFRRRGSTSERTGAGSGDLDDYRIVRARGGRRAWAAAAIGTLILVVLIAVLIVATR